MNQQLRNATRRTVNTLPGLQYQLVVVNLATIASNPRGQLCGECPRH
jgi:hypothetical protein